MNTPAELIRHTQTHNLRSTQSLAGRLARALRDGWFEKGESSGALSLVIGLVGTLGAGKTAFAAGFVEGLDPAMARAVCSPSYAIVQHYPTQPPVAHLDLYRLSALDELDAIGYRDLYFGPGFTLVEWFDAVPGAVLPTERLEIRLVVANIGSSRTWTLVGYGERLGRILGGLELSSQ